VAGVSDRAPKSGQGKDDLQRIRIDDDDLAVGQYEILLAFVRWYDFDETRGQTI